MSSQRKEGTVGKSRLCIGFKCMPLFIFLKEKGINMNWPCRAKAQECQDYTKCDCTDETACGWWAYDRQVTDSSVSNAQHERALHHTAEAPKHRRISKPRRLPHGKPDIQHGAERRFSRGKHAIWAFLTSQTGIHSVGKRGDNRFSRVPWCVLYWLCKRKWRRKNMKRGIKREPEHMYVGVLLSHAWPDSIATGCTV